MLLTQILIGILLDKTNQNFYGQLKIDINTKISSIPILVVGSNEVEYDGFDMLLGMDVIMRGHLNYKW